MTAIPFGTAIAFVHDFFMLTAIAVIFFHQAAIPSRIIREKITATPTLFIILFHIQLLLPIWYNDYIIPIGYMSSIFDPLGI